MRIVKLKKGIPKYNFKKRYKGIKAAYNFKPHARYARSSVKVIVFDNLIHFWRFYKQFCKKYKPHQPYETAGRQTRGMNICLGYDKWTSTNNQTIKYVDPNFISVICFIDGYITYEIINHECNHAAFSYADRTINDNNKYYGENKENREERICYFQGLLSSSVKRVFERDGIKILNYLGEK